MNATTGNFGPFLDKTHSFMSPAQTTVIDHLFGRVVPSTSVSYSISYQVQLSRSGPLAGTGERCHYRKTMDLEAIQQNIFNPLHLTRWHGITFVLVLLGTDDEVGHLEVPGT